MMMQPHTILIADADPVWTGSMARLLKAEGYRVLLARTGADALYQACMGRPDLLLLNPRLTQRNGWEVCRSVKQERGLDRVKVVMLSPDGQRAFRAGADGYLIKGGQVEPTLPPVRAFRQPSVGILAEFQHRRALAA
jgi:DNA-binding response OmpR family regulator